MSLTLVELVLVCLKTINNIPQLDESFHSTAQQPIPYVHSITETSLNTREFAEFAAAIMSDFEA